MKDMESQVPEWGEANRPRVFEFLALLDRELKDRMFIAGDHYTVADVTALVAVDFMRPAKLIMPEQFVHLRRWHTQVGERTSASRSEEHTSELQSRPHLVCRLLLEKKKKKK